MGQQSCLVPTDVHPHLERILLDRQLFGFHIYVFLHIYIYVICKINLGDYVKNMWLHLFDNGLCMKHFLTARNVPSLHAQAYRSVHLVTRPS